MSENKQELATTNKVENQESAAALVNLVKEDLAQSKTSQAKTVPEDQISPALSAFENRIGKAREAE